MQSLYRDLTICDTRLHLGILKTNFLSALSLHEHCSKINLKKKMCKLFGKSPTPSDESIDEKGATPSHQFNNVECPLS